MGDFVVPIYGRPQLWHPAEVVTLVHLAISVARPGCRFLEIGSWLGETSGLFASVVAEAPGTLDCVDTWEGSPGTDLGPEFNGADPYDIFMNRMTAWRLDHLCHAIRGRSQDVCPDLQPGYDFIFIDADHRYSAVSEDLRNADRLVRPGGIICGHDYDKWGGGLPDDWVEKHKEEDCVRDVHCGVLCAVDERFPDAQIRGASNIWYVTRNETSP